MNTPCFLVADVGGTYTRVAFTSGQTVRTKTITRYVNDAYSSLEALLETYLQTHDWPEIEAACVDIAGPVVDDSAQLTNRSWNISRTKLSQILKTERIVLLNDLQAQGYAVATLGPKSMTTLYSGTPRAGNRLVVNIGTGFNIAPVYDVQGQVFVAAAEAGHASLGTQNKNHLDLIAFLTQDTGFAAIEEALSARGLTAISAWHAQKRNAQPLTSMEIFQNPNSELSQATLDTFATLLGQLCGDYALEYLAFAGLFLTGGIARAVAPHLGKKFREAFLQKGRFSDFIATIPIVVIQDDFTALWGCAFYLNQLWRKNYDTVTLS